MHSEEIKVLQAERNQLRTKTYDDNTQDSWLAFRTVRNKVKAVINQTKRAFLSTALSSKRPKEVWRVIHRVLIPSPRPLQIDPNFATTTERTLGTKPDDTNEPLGLVDSLPMQSGVTFCLMQVSHNQVIKEIKELRSDSSTGADQIPVRFIKSVDNDPASLLTRIINACIETSTFPSLWKIARISPIPKVKSPVGENDFRPFSILLFQKSLKD